MGFKCGNTGKEFQTRKEWLNHLVNELRSPILEGDEKDVAHCKKLLEKRLADNPNDEYAKNALKNYD